MRYTEVEDFIRENNLLSSVQPKAGIYAITVDNQIAYIGQSKNIYERCSQHIYHTENAMLNKEKKYLLLLSAKLGGHNIDCVSLEYCEEFALKELEDKWIEQENPILNILTPSGKHDISNLKIEDLIKDIGNRYVLLDI